MARRLSSCFFDHAKAGLILTTMFLVMMSPAHTHAQTVERNTDIAAANNNEPMVARGLIRSNAKTEVRTELSAPILETPFKSGQAFREGDKLVVFNCERYDAELEAAKAAANAAWIEYKSKKRLLAHQAIGKDEVNMAAANASRASAETEVRKVINSDCTIEAPFDGRVVELTSAVGEFPTSDRPLMVILDDRNLEIEILVPSAWLNWLTIGQRLDFQIDETGKSVSAKLSRLGAEIDPVSRTIKVYAKMDQHSEFVLAGMSGQAIFTGGS